MKRSRFATVITAITAATLSLFVAGCLTTSVGTKMSTDNVSKLQKGVTTRAEVETLFGSPVTTSMMGDGRKMMVYNYYGHTIKPTGLGKTFASVLIPGGNLFMGGGARANQEQQTLQIMLTKDGVVEDYEFANDASVTETSGGLLTQQTTTTQVSPTISTNR